MAITIRFGGVLWSVIVFIISARLILCTLRQGIGHRMKGGRRLDTCPGNYVIGAVMNPARFARLPGLSKGPAVRRWYIEACKYCRHI